MHLCDKRGSRAYLETAFPWYEFEEGFADEDELWTSDEMETPPQQAARVRRALDRLFSQDSNTCAHYLTLFLLESEPSS